MSITNEVSLIVYEVPIIDIFKVTARYIQIDLFSIINPINFSLYILLPLHSL